MHWSWSLLAVYFVGAGPNYADVLTLYCCQLHSMVSARAQVCSNACMHPWVSHVTLCSHPALVELKHARIALRAIG